MNINRIKKIADQIRLHGYATLPVKKVSAEDLAAIYKFISRNPHYFVKLHRSEAVQHILDARRDETYGRTKCGSLVEVWEDQISPKRDKTFTLCKTCESVVIGEGGLQEMDLDQYDMFDDQTPLVEGTLILAQTLMNFRDVLRNWEKEGTIEKAAGAAVMIQVLVYALQLGDDTFEDVISGVAKISNEISDEVERFNKMVSDNREVGDA